MDCAGEPPYVLHFSVCREDGSREHKQMALKPMTAADHEAAQEKWDAETGEENAEFRRRLAEIRGRDTLDG